MLLQTPAILAFPNLQAVFPQLGSGCARFGALQDRADFITSLHARLEKSNPFQKSALVNNRQHHSQGSSAQQNNIVFSECQCLFPSLPLLPSFLELESCLPGPYVLPRGSGSSGMCTPRCFCSLTQSQGMWSGCRHQARGEPGASSGLRVRQMALYYPHPSYLCYRHIVIPFINQT